MWKIADSFTRPAVNVDDVTDRLKSVERETGREREPERVANRVLTKVGQDCVDVLERELVISEGPEERDAGANTDDEKSAALRRETFNRAGATVIDQCRGPEREEKPRMFPTIKNVAGENQH